MPGRAASLLLALLALGYFIEQNKALQRRSIDLIAAHGLISETRLPREVIPNSYFLDLRPYIEEGYFEGKVKINITWQEPTSEITLHAHQDLEIKNITVVQTVPDDETLVVNLIAACI